MTRAQPFYINAFASPLARVGADSPSSSPYTATEIAGAATTGAVYGTVTGAAIGLLFGRALVGAAAGAFSTTSLVLLSIFVHQKAGG